MLVHNGYIFVLCFLINFASMYFIVQPCAYTRIFHMRSFYRFVEKLETDKAKKIQTVLRIFFSMFLLYKIYGETGGWTTFTIATIMIGAEYFVYQSNALLKEAKAKVDQM